MRGFLGLSLAKLLRGHYCPGSDAGCSQQQPGHGLVLLLSTVCSAAGEPMAPIYSSWAPYLTKHELAIAIPIISLIACSSKQLGVA